jgi:hypothetical protein
MLSYSFYPIKMEVDFFIRHFKQNNRNIARLLGFIDMEGDIQKNTKPSEKFSKEVPLEFDKEADAFFDKVIMKDADGVPLDDRMKTAAEGGLPSIRIYWYNEKDKAPDGRLIDELVYENPTFLYRLQQLADKYPGVCIERWNEHYNWATQSFNKSIKAIWGMERKKPWPF